MKRMSWRSGWQLAALLGGIALVAGCAPKAPPPRSAPPPPPPVAIVVPPRPTPPDNASPYLVLPAVDVSGQRASVNRGISPAQTVWNLRSAYNVAALNCRGADHAAIVPGYRAFLKSHAAALTRANKAIDGEFRARFGSDWMVPRERYMTEVYNHYALPPTMPAFCATMVALARDGRLIRSAELEGFAARSLPVIEAVFDSFYTRYEAYRMALADWSARYGAFAAPSQAEAMRPAESGPGRNVVPGLN
jgi:hypothetical protein